MNTQSNNPFFRERGCLGQDILLRYRDGLLSGDEKHAVEEHLVDCPLCSEALEGLEGVSAETLYEVKREVTWPQKTGSSVRRNFLLAAASLAAVLLISYFAFNKLNDTGHQERVALQVSPEPGAVLENAPDSNAETFASQPNDTGAPVQNTERFIISNQTSAADDKPATVRAERTMSVQAEETVTLQSVAASDESPREMDPAPAFESTAGAAVTGNMNNNVLITFIDNQKIVDYSVYSSPVEADRPRQAVPGVPAAKTDSYAEKKESKDLSLSKMSDSEKPTYVDSITRPIRLFNRGKYIEAKAGFQDILSESPMDQNAMFYSALCDFHLENFRKAAKNLEPIANDRNNVFFEDARFYSAKANINLGNIDQSREMLEQIGNSNSVYKSRAKEELKNIIKK